MGGELISAGRIIVVGAHGGQYYGEAARAAVTESAVLVGSARHLQFVEARDRHVIDMAGPLDAVLDRIAAHVDAGRDVAVISSGDPGFFGIVRLLGERFGRGALSVHPAPSSVALAFARVGTTWDDAVVISAHGRPAEAALAAVADHPKVAVLTAPQHSPQSLGQRLIESRCGAREVVVATRLGEPDEEVVHTDLAGLASGVFDPMSVVVFLDPSVAGSDAASLAWGLPETAFAHRNGMITKSEVRAVALGKLDLPITGVLWDIGAGSGSVAIECARLRPRLRVFAVERDAVDAERIRGNAKAHGVSVTVITGSAPDALGDLPTPDRVFIGGGGLGVLDACTARLRTGGTIVATHVVVDRASESWRRLGNIVQLSVSRGQPIADGVRLEAQNPVFITWGPVSATSDE